MISVEKTAITNGVAQSAKLLKETLKKDSYVLDYGFGKGRNSSFLKDTFKIDGVETSLQIKNTKKEIIDIFNNIYGDKEIIPNKYDGVLLSYVLNVIPDKETRKNVLLSAYNDLNITGTLFIQVRSDKSLKNIKYKEKYNDGLLVGKYKIKTFQRGYKKEYLKQLLIENNIFNYKIKKAGQNYIAIIKKENFGQMSLREISNQSNYLQLDICGLNKKEALDKYLSYETNLPIILHGDWAKKGASENNLEHRYPDYIDIIDALKDKTNVLGITIHPPTKACMKQNRMVDFLNIIEEKTEVPVFLENRSNNKYIISSPKEVIEFSKNHFMTIDIPQLYIACDFDENVFERTIENINWKNIKELHIGGLVRKLKSEGAKRNMTLVAQQLNKGILNYKKYINTFIKVPYKTFEILGSHNTFEKQISIYKKWTGEIYE